jgi:signal transduction histidine kinase
MRGFAETLLEDDLPEDLRRQWLSSLRTNTLRLQRLVDDLLDLSRLESGGWMARRDVVELEALAQDVLSEFGTMAEEHAVSLETWGGALVVGDEQGLEQVMRNLVENAIRYTPKGGKVSLEINCHEDTVTVSVRDTGVGIPISALPRIFERFYRVDPARSRAEGGTGLGLAIVRHLVHAMGGEVWAESELGHGTAVIFTLPAAKEEAGGRSEPEEEGLGGGSDGSEKREGGPVIPVEDA